MGVSRVLEGCNQCFSRVLDGSHKDVKGCYTSISRVLQVFYKTLSRMLQACYKVVTMVLLVFFYGKRYLARGLGNFNSKLPRPLVVPRYNFSKQ